MLLHCSFVMLLSSSWYDLDGWCYNVLLWMSYISTDDIWCYIVLVLCTMYKYLICVDVQTHRFVIKPWSIANLVSLREMATITTPFSLYNLGYQRTLGGIPIVRPLWPLAMRHEVLGKKHTIVSKRFNKVKRLMLGPVVMFTCKVWDIYKARPLLSPLSYESVATITSPPDLASFRPPGH